MYASGTIVNSQGMPTEINKNGAIANGRILMENWFCKTFKKHLNWFLMKCQFHLLSHVDDILVDCKWFREVS